MGDVRAELRRRSMRAKHRASIDRVRAVSKENAHWRRLKPTRGLSGSAGAVVDGGAASACVGANLQTLWHTRTFCVGDHQR
jgi:hypothetical protein